MKVKFTYVVPYSDLAKLSLATRKKAGIKKGQDRINVLFWHGAQSYGRGEQFAQEFKNKPTKIRLDEMLNYVQVELPYPVSVAVV